MPLVRIDLVKGRPEPEIAALGNAVQKALVATMGVPERDRFQVITEHEPNRFVYNRSYLGVQRSDAIVVVQVFLSKGRSVEQKRAFYSLLSRLLATEANVGAGDLTIVLTENAREDWSFGHGVAQYVELPKDQWK
jgi:phenylpyruvate tautomerase PptA (4-oxalocrotonate tautomerase family)